MTCTVRLNDDPDPGNALGGPLRRPFAPTVGLFVGSIIPTRQLLILFSMRKRAGNQSFKQMPIYAKACSFPGCFSLLPPCTLLDTKAPCANPSFLHVERSEATVLKDMTPPPMLSLISRLSPFRHL